MYNTQTQTPHRVSTKASPDPISPKPYTQPKAPN